jgi:L-asparaginase II
VQSLHTYGQLATAQGLDDSEARAVLDKLIRALDDDAKREPAA